MRGFIILQHKKNIIFTIFLKIFKYKEYKQTSA